MGEIWQALVYVCVCVSASAWDQIEAGDWGRVRVGKGYGPGLG